MTDIINPLDWCRPLEDGDVPERLLGIPDQYRRIHTEVLPRLRESHRIGDARIFRFIDEGGCIAYQVRAGFTMKEHGARAQNTYDWGDIVVHRDFDDAPTQDAIVFWIPCPIPGAFSRNVEEKLAILAGIREEVGLSRQHLNCFGSGSLITLLILTYFETTGRVHLPMGFYAVTDTMVRSSPKVVNQMALGGWTGDGLAGIDQKPGLMQSSVNPEERSSGHDVGCYALGVELL